MIALVIVVIDEPADASLKIARQVVVFQKDAVLERLMPAFDLALCLRMVGRAAKVPLLRKGLSPPILCQLAWRTRVWVKRVAFAMSTMSPHIP
jgi:hypothetical protein